MNIKEFLLDNYIWILVVILLSIITIIGFLADKKKGPKKSKQNNQPAPNPGPISTGTPLNYQPASTDNQQPLNYQNQMLNQQPIGNQNVIQPVNNPINYGPVPNQNFNPLDQNLNINNPINPNNSINDPNILAANINNLNPNMNLNNNLNNPMPVENIDQGSPVNPEPLYQPLSEQKPTFAPRPVEQVNPKEISDELNQSNNYSSPINPIPTNPEPIPSPVSTPQFVNQMNNINPNPQINPNMINQPVQNVIPNYNQSMVNNQPMNVNPQPIPTPKTNTIPNPITPPTPVNPSPVNFVYGPQQPNNNQNM